MNEVARMLAEIEANKKQKKPKKTIPLTPVQRQMYVAAHEGWIRRTCPQAVKDHGIPYCKIPIISSASGLQTFCENMFNWQGHHLERTANMGVMRNGKWTRGAGTAGSSDNKGHFVSTNYPFPIPVYIEVKFGKDVQFAEQSKYERKVTSTGALYTIVTCPADLITFMDYLKTL